MHDIWLFVFASSLTALGLVIFKVRWRWLKYTFINIVLAAVILFAIEQTQLLGSFAIPVNVVTVGTVGLLGLPGMILLFSLKFVLKL